MGNDLEIGSLLDQRFKITGLINQGGMASVYDAIDQTSGQAVAVKVPFLRFESDPAFYSRFQREEEIGQKLNHPSILHFIPVKEKSRPYLVMERLHGRLLSDVLRATSPLPAAEAIAITLRLTDALEYMHGQGVIHRDLKPSNIMMCDDGSLRILDFGLAKGQGERQVTFLRHAPEMGSPDYMAPEQVRGGSRGAKTDLYSLGAVLYEMVTGQKPFRGDDRFTIMHARLVGDPEAPRKVNPEISAQLEEVILHAMERDPEKRFPSAQAMARELRTPDAVVLAGRDARLVPPNPWMIRWRRLRLAVFAVIVVLALVGLILLTSHKKR
jgi:serine/threonine-protein kinase